MALHAWVLGPAFVVEHAQQDHPSPQPTTHHCCYPEKHLGQLGGRVRCQASTCFTLVKGTDGKWHQSNVLADQPRWTELPTAQQGKGEEEEGGCHCLSFWIGFVWCAAMPVPTSLPAPTTPRLPLALCLPLASAARTFAGVAYPVQAGAFKGPSACARLLRVTLEHRERETAIGNAEGGSTASGDEHGATHPRPVGACGAGCSGGG